MTAANTAAASRAYTLADAAASVGLSKRSLQRAHDAGNLNYVYPSGSLRHPRILAAELDSWVKSWPDTPRD